jgi:hypothetical protein
MNSRRVKGETMTPQGYMEKVSDAELINIIEAGVASSVGDFLNSADLAKERKKSTLEYGMIPTDHLSPQGVSQIVSSDTVEAVDGYTAILAELMFNNNKIARFLPTGKTPTHLKKAKIASALTNYFIFKKCNGWEVFNTWVKSSLLWKNAIVRWDYIEDFEYKFEDYEEIDQAELDMKLSDTNTEVVGNLDYELDLKTLEDGSQEYMPVYKNVRLRTKIYKSRIDLTNVPPESFRITRDATAIDNAHFVGIQMEMTRSEIRKYYPDIADNINWDTIGEGSSHWNTKYTEETATRKHLVGQEYWMGSQSLEIYPTEATREVTVIECWIRVDRDGDGIAELKHLIIAGDSILLEEDVDYINLASITPIEIPHEFYGLSIADIIRPSTLASTAILRGFVENVYLTNYAPKLADPNVVDFSALQNMKPKQLIPTNGNPNGAVASLTPDTISTGTVPLLEMLQLHKEQATGLSKAAQGLNDTLYVSGNSEEKMQRAMTAAQVRIQYMARRFAETGFKRLVEGVYKMIRDKFAGQSVNFYDSNEYLLSIDPADLPDDMEMLIDIDVGEHSNSNITKKMQIVGSQVLPALQQAGAGGIVSPSAAANIAAKTLESLDLDPLDYIVDYTTEEFANQAMQSRQNEMIAAEKAKQLEEKIKLLDAMQREATIGLTNVQGNNAIQDNTRQMMMSIDKSHQEWAKLAIQAAKEGVEAPKRPDIQEMFMMAKMAISMTTTDAKTMAGTPQSEQQEGPAAETTEAPGQM